MANNALETASNSSVVRCDDHGSVSRDERKAIGMNWMKMMTSSSLNAANFWIAAWRC